MPGGGVPHYINRQTNAHITEAREVCYPWHPWYGRVVAIREVLTKGHQTVVHCCLEPDEGGKALEVPQWMLEQAVCCTMLLVQAPQVNGAALYQLKDLLSQATVAAETALLQDQPHSSLTEGGADVSRTRTTLSTRLISSSPTRAAVADNADSGQGTNREVAGTAAARAAVPVPQGQEPQGGR